MNTWKNDARKEVVIVDIDELVPQDHLLRRIEKVMDWEWVYERLQPYYCERNGRPSVDPVVIIKIALIQHLYGIPSMRQTHQRISDTVSYRWFLGYGLLERIPHFATVSYAFCNRFPEELVEEIFAHILNKAMNHHLLDVETIFIDGTHIKASANKKKHHKEQIAKTAKVYAQQLHKEINEERKRLGKKAIEEPSDDSEDDTDGEGTSGSGGEKTEKTVSDTDPDCGMFVKGDHERQFAYEAHTACDRHGMVLAVEVTAGNIHDSVAFDNVYDRVVAQFKEIQFVTMDAGYKTPWIAKKILDDDRVPILPYTRPKGKKDGFHLWDFEYDAAADTYICPNGNLLRHTTTDKEGKRTYRSQREKCRSCPYREKCGANEKGEKLLHTHIWQEYLDLIEQIRHTEKGKELYAKRKETIERVFADAKEKNGMRYTHHRSLARVSRWVKLKFAAMNLKKIANWVKDDPSLLHFFLFPFPIHQKSPLFA